MTRRWLLTSVSSAVLAAAVSAIPEAGARPLIMRGGHDAGASGVTPPTGAPPGTYTHTWVNTAGTTSPSNIPIANMEWFAPGDVPAGTIAVPQEGGVDLVYQADQRVYWGDGSLKGAMFRFTRSSALAAGASVQFGWDIRSGSYSNTSAITTADITGGSDFKIVLTNCHTAQVGPAKAGGSTYAQKVASVTIAGGQVSGVKVWFPSNLTYGTAAVPTTVPISNGGGTGASIKIVNGVATILNPGSGFVNVGTGTFTVAFNSVISAINSGGNHANGVRLEQYAKGPICDAWRARTTVSGLNHFHCTFYVERWKKADGTFLAFRATAVPGSGLVDTVNSIPNYTYDLDWKNGATAIRGASLGNSLFTTILHYAGGSAPTFGTDAQMDWSTNHTAWTAIVNKRTPAECDVFKKTGIPLPWLNLSPTTPVPTTTATYESNLNGGKNFYCLYQPFGCAGIRSPLGSGGAGSQEDPMQELDALYWMSLRNGLAGASTWINNIRVGAAHCFASVQLGGQFFEPTTMYVPNVIPSSAATFSGMSPTRETHYIFDVPITGYANMMTEGGGNFVGASVPYHQVCITYGAYIIDGEQWQLDALTHSGTNPLYGFTPSFKRQATLGSTTYYGIYCNSTGNVRVPTWWMRSMTYAVSSMSTVWADGATNIERSYMYYSLKNQLDYYVALASFIGPVQFGSANAPVNKIMDLSGSGVDPESFDTDSGGMELTVCFMDSYRLMVAPITAYLFQGDSQLGASAIAWRDYLKPYAIKLWASPGSHYLCEAWRLKTMTGPPPSAIADITWSGWDPANPKLAVVGLGHTNVATVCTISTTSGLSTVGVTGGGVGFVSGTPIADGSRIMLTTTNNINYGQSADGIPLGMDGTTWYYWKQGATPASGQLCTDLDGSGNPDPATAAVAGETIGVVYFWVVPANTLPADNAGFGTYSGRISALGSSRAAQQLGRTRLWKAYGVPNDSNGNVDDAIASLNAIVSAMSGSYASLPQYGWDSTRG